MDVRPLEATPLLYFQIPTLSNNANDKFSTIRIVVCRGNFRNQIPLKHFAVTFPIFFKEMCAWVPKLFWDISNAKVKFYM